MSVSVMKKLTVLTPVRDADALVRRLIKLKCVDIRTVPTEDDGTLLRLDCDAVRAEAERRVHRVSEAIPLLDQYSEEQKPLRRKPICVTAEEFRRSGRYDMATATVDEALEMQSRMQRCHTDRARVEGLIHTFTPWRDYDGPLVGEGTATCDVWLGVFPPKTLLSAVDDALADLHAGVEEIGRDNDGFYTALMLMRTDEEEVSRALAPLGFLRTSFKGLFDEAGDARANIHAAERALDELDNLYQSCTDRLRELATRLQDLQVLYDVEQTALTAARQKQKLAATEMCAVLEAWIPAEREERVTTALDRLDCAYETADPAPDEDAPILLKNNGYASNFEWVVGMYSYPRYGSFDPTFIMSIFYFLIFGLMFADVGYGLLLTLAGFLAPPLLGMKDGMRRTLNMFGYCGIACTLLGVVFGGWFGDLPYVIMTNYLGYESVEAAQAAVPFFNGVTLTLGGSPVSLNPLENPVAFLVISLGMGLIHMVAGMAVRFYVLWKDKQYVAAIFDVGAYWIIFAGIGCLLVNTTVAFAVLGVGVLMVVAMGGRAHRNIVMRLLMGLKGLYDLISYASDLLSYSRILALGLSAGVVAQVVNLIATMGGPTVPGFLLLVAVMLIGHALNMAINLLGAFVHTSRLQYLEFFGKFYEEGGTPFDPALPSEEYSTAESDAP